MELCKQKTKIKCMFFGRNKTHFFGIDFGTSLIKAVELTVADGKPKLVNYGQVDLARLEKDGTTAGSSHENEVALYLQALLERFQPKSRSVYVAMPAFIGLISLVELPEMNEEELKEAIKFEAHKYIPSPLEEVALSWEVVGIHEENAGGPKKMEILLVAALNKEVERYQKYIADAKLKMEFLELETFSLVRSIIGDQPGVYLLVDIGSRATNLILVQDGLVKMSRNLDVGGKDVTWTLQEGLDVTLERAEVLKKSSKNFLSTPESAMVFPVFEAIGSEAGRMLASYRAKYPEITCQGVVLSGGTAQMVGLPEYYARMLGLPVSIGNPWQRITYDPSATADIKQLGTSFSVALGLALAGIDALVEKKQPFLKKKFSLKELLSKEL